MTCGVHSLWIVQIKEHADLEHLQQFDKLTWHLSNFDKNKKN
jgi:hypothetical protein